MRAIVGQCAADTISQHTATPQPWSVPEPAIGGWDAGMKEVVGQRKLGVKSAC